MKTINKYKILSRNLAWVKIMYTLR